MNSNCSFHRGIVDVMDTYLSKGKNNDSSIIKHIITSNSGNIMDFLKEDDVLIVDRGFRDATPFLNELGFKTQMPAFLQKSDINILIENMSLL